MSALLATTLQFSDFAIIAGIVIFFSGVATAYARSQPEDLRRVERKLDALLKQQGVTLPPHGVLSAEVQLLARTPSQKIAAIKLHREQTGCGLAEAKSDVEEFMKTLR